MDNSLKQRSKDLEDDLMDQISDLSVQAKNVGKQALVIAGGIFVAYQLVKMMSGSKKKKPNKAKVYKQIAIDGSDKEGAQKIIIQEASSSQKNSGIFHELKAEFGAMLLGLIKEKIYEALENMNRKMNQSDDEGTEDSYS